MADGYRDDRDTNYFRESYGAQDTNRNRNDRGQYGEQGTRASGYDESSDQRRGYSGYAGRDYADRYSERGERTVQGSGAGGRNWAERAGDEVKSWVGDDEAERRRRMDAQQMGRYPGEDRGQGRYGANDRSGNGDAYGGRAYGGTSGGGYSGGSYAGRDYGYGDRTVQGSGAGGRNWAERTGDEVKSWVGDDQAERRREQDRQQMGRYPGEQSGERRYGEGYGSSSYGRGDYGSANYSQNQGYGGHTSPTTTYREDYQRGADGAPGYGARASSYTPSSYSAYDDRGSNRTNGAEVNPEDRGFLAKAGDEVKSWFGDEEAERRRQADAAREDAGQAFGGSSTAGYGYTGGTSAYVPTSGTSTPHDPHYAAYRQARMDEYDRDYHAYRQSKAKDFHEDFHSFRESKAGPNASSGMAAMAAGAGAAAGATSGAASGMAARLKEHMVVDGSDGQGIGKIDYITGTDIKLTKHDSTDNKHHLVPISWVASVDGNKVKLSKTSDEAMREWRVADETTKTQA